MCVCVFEKFVVYVSKWCYFVVMVILAVIVNHEIQRACYTAQQFLLYLYQTFPAFYNFLSFYILPLLSFLFVECRLFAKTPDEVMSTTWL